MLPNSRRSDSQLYCFLWAILQYLQINQKFILNLETSIKKKELFINEDNLSWFCQETPY